MIMLKPSILIFVILIVINSVWTTELVPVYLWGTSKINERSHALHKISQDSFKDSVSELLIKNPHIVVFVENTLSPEDFAYHNEHGESPYPNLQNLKKNAAYKPYVQNPVQAIKHLGREVTEMSISTYLNEKPDVPKDNILIIYLNDAKEDEQRFNMLKRHDSYISSIYNNALEDNENVLALYTAHHTSWVTPGEVEKPKKRSLLSEEPPASNRTIFNTTYAYLYVSDLAEYTKDSKSGITINDFTAESEINNNNVTLMLKGTAAEPSFTFDFYLDESGYWYLEKLSVTDDGKTEELTTTMKIFAPISFSYHCGDALFSNNDINVTLSLPGFQVQPFFTGTANITSFGDAYDCVGFTSIPIWSGLFVTSILLIIMTFGLTMMMDIKTMDRFDDPKGKTITINVSE